jgi:diguanylate cyclase (GGDEF)-like protein
MSRAFPPRDLFNRAGPFIRPALFIIYFLLIIFGRFDGLNTYGALHYALAALLLVLVLFEVLSLLDHDSGSRERFFWLGVWIMAAARISVHATGGMDSFLYPLAYILFAVMASALGLFYGTLLWLIFMGAEAGWLLRCGPGCGSWLDVAWHGSYLGGFGAVMGLFVHVERKGRSRAEKVLASLKRDMSEFQRDDTAHRLAGLTEGGRKSEAARSVFALDEAFYGALESGREMLCADTCALYWRADGDGPYHLREISSERSDLDPEKSVIKGAGLVGWVAEEASPLRVSGRRRIKDGLPYYRRSGKADHMMAAPVLNHDRVQGILVADRSGAEEFSEDDEKLMAVLAGQVAEIHGHALLLKRSFSEAAQFKSLAELSHRLSRTLKLGEILDSVIRTSRAVVEHDAVAVVLPDGDQRLVIAATGGELDPRAVKQTAPREGTLAGWAVAERQRLSVPDLNERHQNTPILSKRLDPAGMRSVLIHPLPMRDSARGALVFFSREPRAFTGYMIRVSGILADLAAVSIHNALLYQDMEKRAVTDGLTGLTNHRCFQERLADEIERADRLGNRIALVLLDIDRFKSINDAYGHPVGDEVLKSVADLLKSSIRKVDTAARYGGEEFALILVGTDDKGAKQFAERVRKQTSRLMFHASGKEFRVSISLGVAVYPGDARSKQSLIETADQALYYAKQSGRNRTVMVGSDVSGRRVGVAT